jgi:predicted TIM-barrel fold metal-dependent hydrolase
MIIDTHQHLGQSMFSGVRTTSQQLLAAMDLHQIDLALVMPQPTRDDIRPIHDHIAQSVQQSHGRLLGMASIDPWSSDQQYEAEARRCLDQLGFVGLKLHPLGHNIGPNHPSAEKVFRWAAEFAVPVIVHTGLGTPWSLPSLCIPPARRYGKVSVILAHAGWGVYSGEALVAAEVCPNIYLEPSWCPAYMARKMIDQFGADRVMFGSDHLTNLPVELAKYRSIGLSDDALQMVLGGTARRVFGIDP